MLVSVWSDLTGPAAIDPSRSAIARTAWIAAAAWYAAMALRWRGSRQLFRGVYIWGCAAYLLHVAVAFHLAHGWSHREAFLHVQRSSGFGAGIFVSYAFTLLWVFDAGWCLVNREGYFDRLPKWNLGVYSFMAFVVFNATVVFVLI